MKYYITYITTNLVNGKKYYGQHICNGLDDGYLGSGTLLKLAIEKYGIENFVREQVWLWETFEEMNLAEKDFVTAEVVRSKEWYNIREGGYNGPHSEETKQKIGLAHKGKHVSAETRVKMSKSLTGSIPWNKGKTGLSEHSAETREKMSKSHTGKIVSNETRNKISKLHKGRKRSPILVKEAKINRINKQDYQYTTPDGIFYSLNEIAKHYNISKQTASNRLKSIKFPLWTIDTKIK